MLGLGRPTRGIRPRTTAEVAFLGRGPSEVGDCMAPKITTANQEILLFVGEGNRGPVH
jgi:hypothetical protein